MKDMNSLSHTKRNCKYHIVFAQKYRRKAFYGSNRLEIGTILRELCKWKEVTIIDAEVCSEHVHMFVEIPPKLSISTFMGYLKGKSSVMIYQRRSNLKYMYKNRSFWCRGYLVDTVEKNEVATKKYIEGQLSEDRQAEQLTMDNIDPFTGSRR